MKEYYEGFLAALRYTQTSLNVAIEHEQVVKDFKEKEEKNDE